MKYTVVLMPGENKGYTVICPALPGCVSEGDDVENAMNMIKEAAELWLEVWLEEGRPLPTETPDIVAEEIRACLNDRAEEGLPLLVETREVELSTLVPA
ncbi:MAG: type II toxin-antitoxin system HicB family antitoxin [Chloroflexi bacterium]|nr:type II toxin-antitoxin system HicB family antitoxin [Chloroflexota bacterium]